MLSTSSIGLKGSPECLKWSRRDLENLEATLRLVPGRTAVVQAGGNVGLFPRRLAQEFAAIYTFEPDPALFAALCANAAAPNVIKLQAALGNDRKAVGLACGRRDGSLRPVHQGLTHVSGLGIYPTIRVDDLGLPVCDLIYLDIEGYEFFALRGAEETIKRCRPVIAVEINRSIEFVGLTADDLRGYIRTLGYQHALTANSDEVFVPCKRT